jgi:hypothetical protein
LLSLLQHSDFSFSSSFTSLPQLFPVLFIPLSLYSLPVFSASPLPPSFFFPLLSEYYDGFSLSFVLERQLQPPHVTAISAQIVVVMLTKLFKLCFYVLFFSVNPGYSPISFD